MGLNFDLYMGEETVFETNITHNLTTMANECGVYELLWKPEENGYELAGSIVMELKDGIRKLKSNPKYYRCYDSPNGWGTYENFLPFCERILEACMEWSQATIKVDR
jgi:hypothetical protein